MLPSGPILILLCLQHAAAYAFAGPSPCVRFGARLEQRVNALPAVGDMRRGFIAYKGLVDTIIRGFKGGDLIRELHERSAFEAEAERWVQRAYTLLPGEDVVLTSVNSSSSSSNSSSDAAWPAVSREGAWSCLSRLYHAIMDKFDARPPSFIAAPRADVDVSNGLVLLSGGDRNAALAERVIANHAAFAARHGYTYWWHRGSMVAQRSWLPYWHKIAHLRAAMLRFPEASGYAWVDDDVVLTNHVGEDMIARALRDHNTSVMVTRDPAARATGIALNTGIMILRNDADARAILEEMWRRASAEREDGVSLARDSQSVCLHEQQALQEMVEGSSYWRTRVGLLEQRSSSDGPKRHVALPYDAHPSPAAASEASNGADFNLNTFLRWSHFHAERKEDMRFELDAAGSGWQMHDFAGHCSGLSPVRRALCVAVLLRATVK